MGRSSSIIASMMSSMRIHPLLLPAAAAVLVLVFAASAPARASVADEQRQGAALEQALHSGERGYDSLSNQEFELLGEYWMGRMLGSTRTHAAMNARMRQMMGAAGEERMHALMGQRAAARCAAADGGSAGAYDECGWGAMIDGHYGDYGDYDWGPMMGMMMGDWRQMDSDDWQGMMDRFSQTAAGTGTSGSGDGGWETRDVVLLALAIALGTLLVASLALWRPWSRPRGPAGE